MTGKHGRKHGKWNHKKYSLAPNGGRVVVCKSPPVRLLHLAKPRHGATQEAFIGEFGLNDKWIGTPVSVDFYFNGGKNTIDGTIVGAVSASVARIEWR